jgi:sorbitol-specific phosphotransferase system component IIBC
MGNILAKVRIWADSYTKFTYLILISLIVDTIDIINWTIINARLSNVLGPIKFRANSYALLVIIVLICSLSLSRTLCYTSPCQIISVLSEGAGRLA